MSDMVYGNSGGQLGGRIVSVTQANGQDVTGQWVKGRNVTYQIPGGHTGTVFVPQTQFNPETVMAMVLADAANLANVAGLTF